MNNLKNYVLHKCNFRLNSPTSLSYLCLALQVQEIDIKSSQDTLFITAEIAQYFASLCKVTIET